MIRLQLLLHLFLLLLSLAQKSTWIRQDAGLSSSSRAESGGYALLGLDSVLTRFDVVSSALASVDHAGARSHLLLILLPDVIAFVFEFFLAASGIQARPILKIWPSLVGKMTLLPLLAHDAVTVALEYLVE